MTCSVIVPIRNSESFLNRCLNSILRQTWTDWELLLIDDASSDRSLEICFNYAEFDPRIRVLTLDGRGPGAARNAGLEAMRGDTVCFVDSDDWIEPDMLEVMWNALQRTGSNAALCGYQKEYPDHVKTMEIPWPEAELNQVQIRNDLIPALLGPVHLMGTPTVFMGSVWRLMIQTEEITRRRLRFPEDLHIMEDLLFTMTLFLPLPKLALVHQPLYHYLIHPQSLVHRHESHLYEVRKAVQHRLEEVLKSYWNDQLATRLNIRYLLFTKTALEREATFPEQTPEEKMDRIKQILMDDELSQRLTAVDLEDLPQSEQELYQAMARQDAPAILIHFLKD